MVGVAGFTEHFTTKWVDILRLAIVPDLETRVALREVVDASGFRAQM